MTLATAVLASVLTMLAATAAAAAPVFWKSFRQPVQIEPTRIDINYSTGSAWVTGLNDWRGWGGGRARSTGVAHLNTCVPFCAAGNYKAYRATVTLSKIRSCSGNRRYLDISVAIKAKPTAVWGSDCRGAQVVAP
jgi:hypothetical protein